MTGDLAVSVRDLHVRYPQDGGSVHALRGVSLSVAAGESVAVIGPSGSGKSSLVAVLAGLSDRSAGEVEILGLPRDRLHRKDHRAVGVMLQSPSRNLFALATAAENLLLALRAVRVTGAPARARTAELLDAVGLGERRGSKVRALSGGEQQRLALAVALAGRPRLLLADEPTSQLDRATGTQVARLLQEAHRRDGMALLVVTHDDAVADLFDRTVVIRDGLLSGARG
ncbi:MAG TPA: ATP-binding cassette domain-containing protein [Mycobacteriales bacterium]